MEIKAADSKLEALLTTVVCPVCHSRLLQVTPVELHCTGCKREYPVEDGIPVLIAERSRVAAE